jgi:hypothetical protein
VRAGSRKMVACLPAINNFKFENAKTLHQAIL